MKKLIAIAILSGFLGLPLLGAAREPARDPLDTPPYDDYADLDDSLVDGPFDSVQITKAVYSRSLHRLRVWATSTSGQEAGLRVVKYDKLMKYRADKEIYVYNKKKLNLAKAPKYVKVTSSFGGSARARVKIKD